MQVHLCDKCKSVIYDAPNKCRFYSHDGEAYLHDALYTFDLCDDCFESAKNMLEMFISNSENANEL